MLFFFLYLRDIVFPVFKLFLLSLVPVFYWPVVATDAAENFRFLSALPFRPMVAFIAVLGSAFEAGVFIHSPPRLVLFKCRPELQLPFAGEAMQRS